MQRTGVRKPVSGMFIGACAIVVLPIIVFAALLIFDMLSPPAKVHGHGYYETVYEPPNVAITAAAADNVYIGELLSIDDDTYEKEWVVAEGYSFSLKYRKITVKVTQVLKGDYEAGATVTDEVPESYICFADDVGKAFAFCTGFDVKQGLRARVFSEGSLFLETIWLTEVHGEEPLTGWRIIDNPFIMMRINDDGTVTQGDALTVLSLPTDTQKDLYSVEEDEYFAADPSLNEDVNGSVIRSLMLELSNTDRLAEKLSRVVKSGITEVRTVNSPWSEIYNVSEETEEEFVSRFLNNQEGYWSHNGDTTYLFSEEASEGAVKTEISSITDAEKIEEWQSQAFGSDEECVLSNIHTKIHYQGTPNSNPQRVSEYIALYSGDEPVAVLGYHEYEDAESMGNAVYECYSLYDAETGDYAFCTQSSGNLNIKALVDMLTAAD